MQSCIHTDSTPHDHYQADCRHQLLKRHCVFDEDPQRSVPPRGRAACVPAVLQRICRILSRGAESLRGEQQLLLHGAERVIFATGCH